MEFSSKLIETAVNEISKLPGIGKRTALRLVLFLLRQPSDQSDDLAKAISEVRHKVKFCKNCHNICDNELCDICSNPRNFKILDDKFLLFEVKKERKWKNI